MALPMQVVQFHDAQLYASDVALFRSNSWLNDSAIHFYFEFLFRRVADCRRDVLLMDPALVSCLLLQCDDLEERREVTCELHLETKELVLIPVNDNQSFDSMGSHWSLLVFRQNQQDQNHDRVVLEHFDSSAGHNRHAAKSLADLLAPLFVVSQTQNAPPTARVHERSDSPQQTNSFDCGMYVLLIAEYHTRRFVEDPQLDGLSLNQFVNEQTIQHARHQVIPQLIESLRIA